MSKERGGVFLDQLAQRIWSMQTHWLMMSWLSVSESEIAQLKKGKVPDLISREPRPLNGNMEDRSQPEMKGFHLGKTNVRLTITVTIKDGRLPAIDHKVRDHHSTAQPPVNEIGLPEAPNIQIQQSNRQLGEGLAQVNPLTDRQSQRKQILVTAQYHTKSRGCVFPQFAHKWFQDSFQQLYLDDSLQSLHKFECFTEIKHPSLGNIRCHPNYQGGGPWRDWVLIEHNRTRVQQNRTKRIRRGNCIAQVLCFLRSPKLKSGGPDMALVRTTYPRNSEDLQSSSVLFKRWRKSFDDEHGPTVELVPIQAIIKLVGVVDENPEMIDERHGVSLFLNSDEEREILQVDQQARNGRRETFCHDIVWEVLDIMKWAGEFLAASRFTRNSMIQQDATAQRE
jgi:hypothetical protein